ncbi:hypothetical protein PIROE2DRAFT_9728 [Piromyces sp. E2]|nr:hypothetical protein PIROE2DRAFT_9728 [Piromyces sp. E2]|eukprot:OUM63653.1 hypothetical protein PIROE2DRAFT_9728 [Piromyces sp. E2]
MDVISPSTWESRQVAAWISSIGFNNLEKKIIDNGISGELLIHADHDLLKELNVKSVGSRLKILNSIYGLKLKYNVPIEDYDYIPQRIKMEMEKDIIINETKYKIIDNKYKENEQCVNKLSQEVKKINEDMKQFKDDIKTIKLLMNNNMPKSDLAKVKSSSNINLYSLAEPENSKTCETIKVYSALEKQECETLYKSLKLTSEDTTEGFLAEVLKKYQIKNNIALYRLSINSDRYLKNDEHPLEVLQNFRTKGIEAQLFLRKINLKEEQKAKLNSVDLKAVSLNSIKDITDKAYVLLPYKKKKDNEVSVELGETIEILDRESVEKYRVQKKGGIIGYLPTECFVEKEEGDEMVLYDMPLEGEIRKDYKKVNAYEISLKKGDKVKIHAKFRTWIYVESFKKQGWMPHSNITLRRPRSFSSPLSQSRSLEEISKIDGNREDSQQFLDLGSNSSIINSRKINNSTNYINELEKNQKSFIMEGVNEKEKVNIESYLIDIDKDKKLPQVPTSASVDNIHIHASPHRVGPNNNLTSIKTNIHLHPSSSNESISSANSTLYTKFHLPTHSRNNSTDCGYIAEKESAHTPLSALSNNSNQPPISAVGRATPIVGSDNESNTTSERTIKNNAFMKLNNFISNFSPYDSENEIKKPSPSPNKYNIKPFQNH